MTPPEGKPGCIIPNSEMEHNDLMSWFAMQDVFYSQSVETG